MHILVYLGRSSNLGVTYSAHAAGAKLAIDNTFANPLVCRPLDRGADLVI